MTDDITKEVKTVPELCEGLSPELIDLLKKSKSENSRKALDSDLRVLARWLCQDESELSLPITDIVLAEFIAAMSSVRAPSTIVRYVSSISRAHEMAGLENPARSEIVRTAIAGLRRSSNVETKKTQALRFKDLIRIVDSMSKREWISRRNKTMIIIGWCGALRLSELVALDIQDIAKLDDGIYLKIRKSKSDQESRGAIIGIPKSPLTEIVLEWTESLKLLYTSEDGPLFPRIGCSQADRWFPPYGLRNRLSSRSASKIIKGVLADHGICGSSHSLRRGLITEAAAHGVPELTIQRHSRHRSVSVLRGYVDQGNALVDNPLHPIFASVFP